jgi:hypothetical protein
VIVKVLHRPLARSAVFTHFGALDTSFCSASFADLPPPLAIPTDAIPVDLVASRPNSLLLRASY